jgi:hypothetical protein
MEPTFNRQTAQSMFEVNSSLQYLCLLERRSLFETLELEVVNAEVIQKLAEQKLMQDSWSRSEFMA